MQFKVFQAGHEEHIRDVTVALLTQLLKEHSSVGSWVSIWCTKSDPFINIH